MISCPVCSFGVADARGLAAHFRHQASTHPNYNQWCGDQRFGSMSEPRDYVSCLVCGQRAETLARHLKASHGITAGQYKATYPNALIRAEALTSQRSEAAKSREGGHGKGDTKTVTCPGCGTKQIKSKFLVQGVHDFRCPTCKERDAEVMWADLVESVDYVQCLECAYRAENLTSHVQNAHAGYRDRHPDAPMIALNSAVRDKDALKGRVLSDEIRQRMSDNAGRWNKGLTKETDGRVARMAESMMGRPSWSKGLTADRSESLARTAAKLQMYVGENRLWDNGLAANLTLADFQPFMDSNGRVDHQAVVDVTGISWVTIRKYIVDLGLAQTNKYIEARAEAQTIRLEKADLLKFALGNGKVSIGKAIVGLGRNFNVIKRECERHGLPTFHRHISQEICMEAVSMAIGGLTYESEWRSRRFMSAKNAFYRFDGYFPDVGLVVEFHGHQHYIFPNAYMLDDNYLPQYEAMVERDLIKREMITNAPDLTYLEVLEDEPYTDATYLTGRLVQAGVLEVRPGGIWLGNKLVRPAIEGDVR